MTLTTQDITKTLQTHLHDFILNALTNLYRQDLAILKNPTSTHVYEPCLTMRIGMHIRDQLKHNDLEIDFELDSEAGYRVDCEYNRHGSDPKNDSSDHERRPDILIHKRAISSPHGEHDDTPDQNILFCETKWGQLNSADKNKLEAMAQVYQYYCSLGIENITGDGIKLVFRFANNDYQEQTEEYNWVAETRKLVKR